MAVDGMRQLASNYDEVRVEARGHNFLSFKAWKPELGDTIVENGESNPGVHVKLMQQKELATSQGIVETGARGHDLCWFKILDVAWISRV